MLDGLILLLRKFCRVVNSYCVIQVNPCIGIFRFKNLPGPYYFMKLWWYIKIFSSHKLVCGSVMYDWSCRSPGAGYRNEATCFDVILRRTKYLQQECSINVLCWRFEPSWIVFGYIGKMKARNLDRVTC